jgi:hypothetical protein
MHILDNVYAKQFFHSCYCLHYLTLIKRKAYIFHFNQLLLDCRSSRHRLPHSGRGALHQFLLWRTVLPRFLRWHGDSLPGNCWARGLLFWMPIQASDTIFLNTKCLLGRRKQKNFLCCSIQLFFRLKTRAFASRERIERRSNGTTYIMRSGLRLRLKFYWGLCLQTRWRDILGVLCKEIMLNGRNFTRFLIFFYHSARRIGIPMTRFICRYT